MHRPPVTLLLLLTASSPALAHVDTRAFAERLLRGEGPTIVGADPYAGLTKTEKSDVLGRLAEGLQSPNRMKAYYASEALAKAGADAIPFVVPVAKSGDAEAAVRAVQALAALPTGGGTAIVDVFQVAASTAVRCAAARAFRPEQMPVALSLLLKALDDANAGLQACVAEAIGQNGPAASAAVPALARELASADDAVRIQAARALAQMGEAARPALPALLAARNDANEYVRFWSVRSLAALARSSSAAAAGLKDALKDPDADIRGAAAVQLLNLGGPRDPDAQPVAVLRSLPESERETVFAQLDEHTPVDEDLVRFLLESADSDDRASRTAAGQALVRIGGKTIPFLTRIEKEDERLAPVAAWALSRVNGQTGGAPAESNGEPAVFVSTAASIRGVDFRAVLAHAFPECRSEDDYRAEPRVYVDHVAYGDLDGDGREEAVLDASTCNTGTAGPDVHAVYRLERNGRVTELPIKDARPQGAPAVRLIGNVNFRLVPENGMLKQVYYDGSNRPAPLTLLYRWTGTAFVVDKAIAGATYPASFDCRSAKTDREITVCGHKDLAELDRALATTYAAALARSSADRRASLRADQRRWLEQLDGEPAYKGHYEFVKRAYEGRLEQLKAIASESK